MDLNKILEKYFSEAMTDEVKFEIETVFEAAVKLEADARNKAAKAELEEKYSEELTVFKNELVETLSDYLEDTYGEWFEENKPAEVSTVKVAMAESVMKKLTGVLVDNFVEIKDEDIDVVKDLETKLSECNDQLDSLGNEKIELRKQVFEYEKAIAFTKMTEGMTMTDKESLLNLLEDIAASDIATFTAKVNILKEKMISASAKIDDQELEEEEIEAENPGEILSESELDKFLPKF